MSVDHPHGGGEDFGELIAKIHEAATFFKEAIFEMASTEEDVRTGGVFVLMNEHGDEIDSWTEGELTPEQTERYYGNAWRKCKYMYVAGVVCSGIDRVAEIPNDDGPIYDGGIKFENGWFLAFSGFRAVLDRTYCILIGNHAELLEVPGLRYNTILQSSPEEALVRGLVMAAMASAMLSMLSKDDDEDFDDRPPQE